MLCLHYSLEWGHFAINMFVTDRDVTGEGKGWRNGHGWGWREFFNIITQEMPIPLSHLANDIGGKNLFAPFKRVIGHGKSNLPIRRSVDCHICSTAIDINFQGLLMSEL